MVLTIAARRKGFDRRRTTSGRAPATIAGMRRVALVTGSSRGLGRVIAQRLAAAGHAVAVNGRRDDDDLHTVAREIRARGGTAEAFAADVTDAEASAALAAAIAARLGAVDIVVFNATGPQPEAPLQDTTWADHVDQLRFFVGSPVVLGRALLPAMRERGWGRVVHLDSEVVDRVPAGRSAYIAAKAAQVALMRASALELAPFGITVNAVAPGFVPVERHADVGAGVRDAYVAEVPLGRFGTPEDVAAAVAFFASEEAGFLTGQRLVVDGGRGLR
jgi:3-oxoacyl-[acyl-carrier protein] reductase